MLDHIAEAIVFFAQVHCDFQVFVAFIMQLIYVCTVSQIFMWRIKKRNLPLLGWFYGKWFFYRQVLKRSQFYDTLAFFRATRDHGRKSRSKSICFVDRLTTHGDFYAVGITHIPVCNFYIEHIFIFMRDKWGLGYFLYARRPFTPFFFLFISLIFYPIIFSPLVSVINLFLSVSQPPYLLLRWFCIDWLFLISY